MPDNVRLFEALYVTEAVIDLDLMPVTVVERDVTGDAVVDEENELDIVELDETDAEGENESTTVSVPYSETDSWALGEVDNDAAAEELTDTDEETDTVDVGVDKPVKDCVTVTDFVTPVGKVVGDAVPVLTEEDDAVRVAPLLTLDEGELVLECVDVRDDVVELVIVADI